MRYTVIVNKRFQNVRVYKIAKKINDRSNKISRAVLRFLEKKANGGKEF